jgi:hypothetical protein
VAPLTFRHAEIVSSTGRSSPAYAGTASPIALPDLAWASCLRLDLKMRALLRSGRVVWNV